MGQYPGFEHYCRSVCVSMYMITAPAVVCGTSCLFLVYTMCMVGISDAPSQENVLGAFFLSIVEIITKPS